MPFAGRIGARKLTSIWDAANVKNVVPTLAAEANGTAARFVHESNINRAFTEHWIQHGVTRLFV